MSAHKVTPAQLELLYQLTPGVQYTVLTSQYADYSLVRKNLIADGRPNEPIISSTSAAVRGLAQRGLIEATLYWRGATVTCRTPVEVKL